MDITTPITPDSLFTAKGLVVVITGGGSGLGLAIASALYQNSAAKIYLLGRRLNVLEDAIKTLESSPSALASSSSVLRAIKCDVADLESVRAAALQIENESIYVDVLFNNAGVIGPMMTKELYAAGSIEQVRDAMLSGWDGWTNVMAINTQSVIGVSALFLPLLEAENTRRGWKAGRFTGNGIPQTRDTNNLSQLGIEKDDDRLAHIITTSSTAAHMRWVSAGLAYNASKSAAVHLGKMMSSFLSEWGVRSNVICPGPYPSEMNTGPRAAFGANQVPQGRMGDFNDIGGMALFLVGKGGAYINGSVQLTDGGRVGVFPGTY